MLPHLLTWVPLLVSVTALFVTAFFNISTYFDRKTAARLAREKDLHDWVRQLAEIYATLMSGEESIKKSALSKLCIMIDYGRLLFPNEKTAPALAKSPKGLRSGVLDPLVETCSRCESGNWSDYQIKQDWREFTDQLNTRTTAFAINTSPETEGRTQYRNP